MTKLLGFFIAYTVIQAISVRWLLKRPIRLSVRLLTLVLAVAALPIILWIIALDPPGGHWTLILFADLAIAGALAGFVAGLVWHCAAPWFQTK